MSISGHRLRRLLSNIGEPGPTEIGQEYGGGFYFSDTTIGGVEYYLIIADKSSETNLQWKTSRTETLNTESLVDGLANSNAMNNTDHPAAMYCRSYLGGGFDDWYLPAMTELNLVWLRIPPGGAGTPDRFKTGGDQAMAAAAYWTSSQYISNKIQARGQNLNSGAYTIAFKDSIYRVRPIRRVRK